jgi:DNA invertase Pin-like site-specific DNA recombinase
MRSAKPGSGWEVFKEFVAVKSGSNSELVKAKALCRLRNATLVIAKIDRLSRDELNCSNLVVWERSEASIETSDWDGVSIDPRS